MANYPGSTESASDKATGLQFMTLIPETISGSAPVNTDTSTVITAGNASTRECKGRKWHFNEKQCTNDMVDGKGGSSSYERKKIEPRSGLVYDTMARCCQANFDPNEDCSYEDVCTVDMPETSSKPTVAIPMTPLSATPPATANGGSADGGASTPSVTATDTNLVSASDDGAPTTSSGSVVPFSKDGTTSSRSAKKNGPAVAAAILSIALAASILIVAAFLYRRRKRRRRAGDEFHGLPLDLEALAPPGSLSSDADHGTQDALPPPDEDKGLYNPSDCNQDGDDDTLDRLFGDHDTQVHALPSSREDNEGAYSDTICL